MAASSKGKPGQDTGWSWMIVLAAAVSQTAFGMAGRTMGVYYMMFTERYHESATATAIATGIPMLLWGLLGKWRCRQLYFIFPQSFTYISTIAANNVT